jgi:hypothetical protein
MRGWFARALLPVALVAGVALSLVPAGSARAGRLLTGFERRGGTSWTTPAEERDFLRSLVEGSAARRSTGRISITRIGTSARGRPLELITLTGPSTVPEPIRVLFVCGQHGDEPAGREAGLKLVRDLVEDRSAAGRRLLERVTVLVLPTPNPDGLAADTRATADGVDLNRDHLAVSTPEARAIRRVLREMRPEVVHDMHEFATPVGIGDAPFLYLWPRNLNVTPALRALSVELARDRMGPALRAAGWQAAVFGTTSASRDTAGDADERLLRNIAGTDHAVAVLAEVAATPLSALEQRDAGLLGRRRVAAHTVAARATLRMAAERADAIVAAARASREQAERGGAQIHFDGADNAPAERIRPGTPPCAYRLTPDTYEVVRQALSAHGIRVDPDLRVETAQPAGALIPLLLDPRARFGLTAADATTCASDGSGASHASGTLGASDASHVSGAARAADAAGSPGTSDDSYA